MQRHGSDYKIGRTTSLNKRGRQIQIELPQEVELVHSILTDDPVGVEAYLGLLGALHKAAVQPSVENSKEFALWQTRCQLFGSPDVSLFIQAMVDTNDGPRPERDAAFSGLVESMRVDLRC